MTRQEKINYLIENHYMHWLTAKRESEDIVSDSQPMMCCCGRVATGLHEMHCTRYQAKVDTQALKKLNHLLPRADKAA